MARDDSGRVEPERCVLCRGTEHTVVSRRDRKRRPLTSVMCQGCGLVFNSPVPDDATLAEFYSERYRLEYKGMFEPRRRQVVRNFAGVLEFFRANWPLMADAGTCLDVGAGSGEFLFFAQNTGLRAVGLEPNRAYAAYCRERLGLDVTTGFIGDFDYPAGGAGLIRLNHVLEHLNDPVASLRALRRWLADDGLLHVAVPNIEIYAEAKSRGNMFHFGHVFNFNPWTLRACAGLAGLEEVEELRARNAAMTGTFFRKGRTWTAEEARNAGNAVRVREPIARHYSEWRIRRALAKLGRKLGRGAGETRTGTAFGDPARIGAHFVAQFRPPEAAPRELVAE